MVVHAPRLATSLWPSHYLATMLVPLDGHPEHLTGVASASPTMPRQSHYSSHPGPPSYTVGTAKPCLVYMKQHMV